MSIARLIISLTLMTMATLLIVLVDSMESLLVVVEILLVIFLSVKIYFGRMVRIDFFNVIYFAFLFLFYFDLKNPPTSIPIEIVLSSAKLLCAAFFILASTLIMPQIFNIHHSVGAIRGNGLSKIQVLGLSVMYLVFIVAMIPTVIIGLQLGRNSGSDELMTMLPFFKYLIALSYVIPGVLGLMYSSRQISIYVLLILVTPIFIIQISNGSRFVVLFSLFILLSFIYDLTSINVRKAAGVLITFLVISAVMVNLRSGGLAVEDLFDNLTDDFIGTIFKSEGLLLYFSALVHFHDINGHSYLPVQSLFASYFYVPREFWPDKPQMIGSWILDSSSILGSFSSNHSGSVSFFGPFYSDFGYLGFGVIFILGNILNRIEITYFKLIQINNLNKVIVAGLIPTIFFAMRSFNTAMITFVTIICLVYFLKALGGRRDVA